MSVVHLGCALISVVMLSLRIVVFAEKVDRSQVLLDQATWSQSD